MATSPCEPIDPAVTHTLSWQVGNFAITSENRQIGFREGPSSVETIKKFTEFLESNQVTPLSAVLADGVLRPAQWSSKPPAIPSFKYAEYQLWSSRGIIYIYTPTPTGTERESFLFFNTEKIHYYGASSEGFQVILPDQGYWSNLIVATIFNAINKINSKLAFAYPQATRVLPSPPPPLFEDEINFSSSIGCNANFKIYIEYQGPDGEFVTTIKPPGWRTWGRGENIAETDWSFENKPPLYTIEHMLQFWGGSEPFIDFFFRRDFPHPMPEGKCGLLIQPIWIGDREDAGSNTPIASGGMSTSWGKDIDGNKINEVAKFWAGGEFGAFTKFTRFDSKETYLFTHQWEIAHLHLVATKLEIKTTPPVIPKLTNVSCAVVITDPATPGRDGTYFIRVSYTKQYATENSRDEATINDPPPVYQTVSETYDTPSGYYFISSPSYITLTVLIVVDGHLFTINTVTNDYSPKWGKGNVRQNCFAYEAKVYYETLGRYVPNGLMPSGFFIPKPETTIVYKNIDRLGFLEEPLPNWVGSADEDKPDALPADFSFYYDTGQQLKIAYYGEYEELGFIRDHEVYETTSLKIDCHRIGGGLFYETIRRKIRWPDFAGVEY